MTIREPPLFPPIWAAAWGDDVYGLWAEFVVSEVRQRMRWIEPGEFWMGAPDKEPERFDDEMPQHRVHISRGYWLADTACTQALWEAVMGSNPSRFDDNPLCPVETVSWHDVQGFLSALQQAGIESQPDLPTEAEWEYACRAGTDTAFSFGARITPQQVNYDGNYPYGNAERGEYRERTLPVKALPANAWGLYQMHGNVDEWCADGLRVYADAFVADPEGPRRPPASFVVRGGSCFSGARNCRSAYRYRYMPGIRYFLGFRLVLRS